jgi:hypothetical protein
MGNESQRGDMGHLQYNVAAVTHTHSDLQYDVVAVRDEEVGDEPCDATLHAVPFATNDEPGAIQLPGQAWGRDEGCGKRVADINETPCDKESDDELTCRCLSFRAPVTSPRERPITASQSRSYAMQIEPPCNPATPSLIAND